MRRSDLVILLFFPLLAILFLWPVTLGGQTLIPADNLFAFPPWSAFATQFNTTVPHNELLSDLLLENYAWKKFIVETIRQGQLPLWNPYLFTGVPFLAAGQHSALYPFSILFYLFPLEVAYGWFVAIQLGIAGAAMYAFGRALNLSRLASLIAALTYEFSGFFLVSLVFPMVISAACWLPLLLLCEEKIIQGKLGEIRGDQEKRKVVGWVVIGALVLGVSFLAGHIEIAYYNLLVMAFYAAWRIVNHLANQQTNKLRQFIQCAAAPIAFVVLGIALAAVQLIPLYELVWRSFRQGSQSYETIVGYAYPIRQLITFFIPDFFGNPSHHGYFDLCARQWTPVTHDVNGAPINTIFWGVKNYVEAGSYVGVLPMLLALIAIITSWREAWFALCRTARQCRHAFGVWHRVATKQSRLNDGEIALLASLPRNDPKQHSTLHALHFTPIFFVLALLSLAFVFGTPLYALLFYGLPGINQLHSPFRWVYPYTLSIAVLAGIGTQSLLQFKDTREIKEIRGNRGISLITLISILLGSLILLILALSWFAPAPFIALAERILRSSDLAQHAFPDARAFFSYEAINIAKFALFLLSAGALIRIARCPIYTSLRITHRASRIAIWKPLAVLILLADLFTFGYGFYPAADPQLLKFTPPAVKFLQQDPSLFRIATLNAEGEKTFNANVGMFYGLQDIRGYDSIIPKQYADWMNLIEGQGELIYNRIAPFYWHGSLDSALLDLANVKYVLTTQGIPNTAKFTKVYTGEINIYRNERVLPRAFAINAFRTVSFSDPLQLKNLDPTKEVLLDLSGRLGIPTTPTNPPCPDFLPATITKYSANDVIVELVSDCAAWLVLTDAYFDGWQAFDKIGNISERELTIYRADGNFRAVLLDGHGLHTIRFKYNPLSFRVGLYLSFFAAMALLLMGGYWAWGKLYRAETHEREAKRVLKNSALPMATALLNKVIDTLFAAFMLRVLGPENAGKYAFAVIIIAYCDIFINFGLSTLVTRDVSRERNLANRYVANTVILRLLLLAILTPLLAVFLWVYRAFFGLSDDVTIAVILLALGLLPSGISSALSSIFYAYELMEYPAAITVITTLLKVTVGVIVLLAGLGFVGLAGTNIFVNLATLAILLALFVRKFFVPRLEFDPQFGRTLVGASYPLMLNDLLIRAFNRVDVLLLQPLKGNTVVGWYTTSYKYLDGLNILPSTFTIALFPVLSRYAAGAPDALMRAYLKSMKYLVIIAMPLMVLSFAYADFIILLFGGPDYLPEAAIALRLIIGFLPLSFINNVTHYVLIAVNQQKYLTRTFVSGAAFNILANLIFIPTFSYRASAVITIFSELVLLAAFYWGVRQHVGKVDWFGLLWRPVLATVVMSLALGVWQLGLGIGDWGFGLAIPLSLVAYLLTLVITGAFDGDDRELMRILMPAQVRAVYDKISPHTQRERAT